MSLTPRNSPTRLWQFYLIALGISWAGWIPFAAREAGLISVTIVWEIPIFAQFGPSVAAFLLAGIYSGKQGVRKLFGKVLKWRIHIKWYAIALFTVPVLALVSLAIHHISGNPVPGMQDFAQWHIPYSEAFGSGGVYSLDKTPHPSFGLMSSLREMIQLSPWLALLNFIVFAIVTGPVSEEFGWRGYLLPRLQGKYSAIKASVIIGVLWGFWHTGPDFWRILLQGNAMAFLYPLAMTVGTIPLSIIFTWLFNNNGSSLIPPMLFHASFNSTLSIMGLVWTTRSSFLIGAELVLGLWLLVIFILARKELR